MIGCVESELQSMRNGLHDVIPSELLSSLTPEVSRRSCFQQYDHIHYWQGVYCMKYSIYVCPIRKEILDPFACDKSRSVKVRPIIFRYFHILFRIFSCCCQVVQQMWTSTVFVLSSHSATVMAVRLIYLTDSNGKWQLPFKLKNFLTFGLERIYCMCRQICVVSYHAPADCSRSLSWIVIEPFLRPSPTVILTYIFVVLALPGGFGPLCRRWLPFKDSSCCTFAQEAPCFQLCPTEGILTKVPFSCLWRVWVKRTVTFSCRVTLAEPSVSAGLWLLRLPLLLLTCKVLVCPSVLVISKCHIASEADVIPGSIRSRKLIFNGRKTEQWSHHLVN